MKSTAIPVCTALVFYALCVWAPARAEQSALPAFHPTRHGTDCASVAARDLARQASHSHDEWSDSYTQEWASDAGEFYSKNLDWAVLKPLGDCLFKRHEWLFARTAYERAVADQANYPGAMPADELADAYSNLGVIANHFSDTGGATKYSALLAAEQAKIANEPWYEKPIDLSKWPGYTKDEVRVIQGHGGTPENVEAGLPCHHEIFTSGDRTQDTWWYCDAQGNYTQSYTFVNGSLDSTYQP